MSQAPIDILWVLLCAALVMLMQAGFSCLESGSVRTKNSINVAAKNFADFCVSSAVFWLFGFALMFGVTNSGLFGTSGFLFADTASPWLMAFFIFQLGFCGTAVTIMSGAVAERMRFAGYLVATVVLSALIYPLVGHWVWGSAAGATSGGWLEQMGFIDFAGSTVVHSVGGWVSLAAVIIIGPRIGRFGKDAVPIHGHDLPLVTLGVFLLWFGWFGFNGGSTLGLTPEVPTIIVNTTISGAFGGLVAMALSWRLGGRPDVSVIMNGSLAGLVGITASAHIMTPLAAVAIGAIAAVFMYGVTRLLERLEIDDVVGAVPVHLAAGIWGTLAVAIFGDPASWGTGLGRWEQFAVQATGVGTCFAWAFGVGFTLLWLINRWFPLRIDPEGERVGLNVADHGASTEILDLLTDMDKQRQSGDFSQHVGVEPHTEVGQIARQYNRILDEINAESAKREAATEALRQKTESLQLLQKAAVAANQAKTVEDAIRTCLDDICAFGGWPVGHCYMVDDATGDLISARIWHLDDPERFKAFRDVTEAHRLTPGPGLAGRALATREPTWIADVTKDATFRRAKLATDIEVKGGAAFPVLVGEDVVAVLEFFSPRPEEPDQAILDVMASVGTQLGRIVERRRSEAARFQSVVDNMPALVHLRDESSRFILVNREYEEFYGVTNRFIRGKTLHEASVDAKVDLAAEANAMHDREVIETNSVIEREFSVLREGKSHILADVKFPVRDHAGEIIAIGGVELDITERKAAERALALAVKAKESALQELSVVLDTIDYGVLFMDSDLRIRTDNRAYRQIWNLPERFHEHNPTLQNAIEYSYDQGLHEVNAGEREAYITARIEAIRRGRIDPTEFELTNGKVVQFQCLVLPDDGRMLTFFDITNRIEAEQALRQSEALLKAVVDHLPAAVFLKDLDGRYTLVNRRYEDLYGVTHEQVRGKTAHEVHSKIRADDFTSFDHEAIEAGRHLEREHIVRQGGKETILSSVMFPILDKNGTTTAIGGIEIDITDRKQGEIELHEAMDEAMRATQAKSQFLANMSHELRTPMNAIIGFTRLVMRRSKADLEAKQYENLEKVLSSAEQLLLLINDILDLSKIEAGQMTILPTEFALDTLIDDCLHTVEPLVKSDRLRLVQEVEPDLPPMFSDQEKVRQILINLLSNAVKFTEEGAVTVRARHDGDMIVVDVSDTGIGIAEDALSLIFEQFRQTDDSSTRRYGGTGLGLAITRHLAQFLGGDITVESTVGAGSTFTASLLRHYEAAKVKLPSDAASGETEPIANRHMAAGQRRASE